MAGCREQDNETLDSVKYHIFHLGDYQLHKIRTVVCTVNLLDRQVIKSLMLQALSLDASECNDYDNYD
jgi:hypothetical protein